MKLEIVSYPDGDIQGHEGMDSVVVDSVELTRWDRDNPPVWVGPVRELFAQRDQIAAEAMAR